MKEYYIGDKPWLASYSYAEIKLTCPACYGKLQIKVILGNDEEVIVPCNSCDMGYQGSVGFITENEYIKKVEQITISKIDAEESLYTGRKIVRYYFSGGYSACPDDNMLFDSKEEAEKRVNELVVKYELEKQQSITRKKQDPSKTYGWHVRCHSREIKELERKLEYHKKKLIICKEHDKKSIPL